MTRLPLLEDSVLNEILIGARLSLLAGIRASRKLVDNLFDQHEQSILAELNLPPDGPASPRRSPKSQAAIEASLAALVSSPAPVKRGRPAKALLAAPAVPVVALDPSSAPAPDPASPRKRGQSKESMQAYWAQFTKEQKREMMVARMRKRTDPIARKILANAPKLKSTRTFQPDPARSGQSPMINGRYTKVGVAKLLGIAVSSVHRYLRGVPFKPVGKPSGGTPIHTYSPAHVKAVAKQQGIKI